MNRFSCSERLRNISDDEQTHRGFEMVIVLVMVGILTAGLSPMLLSQHTRSMEDANKQALKVAKDVVVSYALTNGGLPLPLTSAAATAKNEYVPTYLINTSTAVAWVLPPTNPPNESYLPWDEHMVSAGVNLPPLGEPTFGSYRKYFWYDPRNELRNDFVINTVSVYDALAVKYLPLLDQTEAAGTLTGAINALLSFCANVKTALKATPSDPRVCRLPRNNLPTEAMNASCPGTITEASSAAFVLVSFGNDRTPDKAHRGVNLLAATPVRNYENPARPVNFEHATPYTTTATTTADDEHYDDTVLAVSLAEMASRCDQSGVSCSASNRYLTIKNTSAATVYYKLGTGGSCTGTLAINTRVSPECLDAATQTSIWSDAACTANILSNTLYDLGTNGDGVASIWTANTANRTW